MAKTFYGYAERDADSQLDWSKIGKSFSDMLSAEAKKREELKDQLDEQTTQSLDVLKKTPMGNHEGVNTWILDYSGDAQEQLLMIEKELKAGRLKPKDYTKQRERLTTGTQQLYEIVDGYQKEYDSKLQRYQNGESAGFEGVMMESLESMSNFTAYKPIINPATGEVMVAKRLKDKDGNYGVEISDDPNDMASTQILLGRITQNYDKYDLLKNANVLGARYGQYKKVIGKGKYTTITDKRLFDEFETRLSDDVDGILTNSFYAASVLDDYLDVNPETGELYYYTADKNDKNPNAIHYEYKGNGKTPSFNLTDKQMGAAKDAYVSAVKASLSREEQYKAPAPSRYSGRSAAQRREDKNYERLFNLTKDFVQNPTTENLTTINQYGGGGLDLQTNAEGKTTLTIVDNKGGEQKIPIDKNTDPAYLQEIMYMSQVGGNAAAGAVFEKNKRGTASSLGEDITTKSYQAQITRPTKTDTKQIKQDIIDQNKKQLKLVEFQLSEIDKDLEEIGDSKNNITQRALLKVRREELVNKKEGLIKGEAEGDSIFNKNL
jgi:hypothetical protein